MSLDKKVISGGALVALFMLVPVPQVVEEVPVSQEVVLIAVIVMGDVALPAVCELFTVYVPTLPLPVPKAVIFVHWEIPEPESTCPSARSVSERAETTVSVAPSM